MAEAGSRAAGPGPALRLLGPPRVERNGAPVEFDTRKAIALLAYLAVEGPRRRDQLAALLWPDSDQARGRGALRRTLSAVRSALGPEAVRTEGETVELGPEVRTDVEEFRGVLAGGGDAALAEAAAMHRGDFLQGFSLRDSPEFDDWQFYQAEGLRRELGNALELLVARLAQTDPAAAIQPARRRLSLDRLSEPAHRSLMELFARSGQRSAALRQYAEAVRVLEEELGVEPLPETAALYRAIEEGRLEPTRADSVEPGPLRPEAPEELPLVGRDAELGAALEAYRKGSGGHLFVIEGEAGIGKTRLAESLVARVGNARVAQARAHQSEEGLPYASLLPALRAAVAAASAGAIPRQALAEAGRLLPELASDSQASAASLDSPAAFTRFVDGLSEVLLGGLQGDPPGVLLLDDLQWADQATIDVVSYLVRRLSGRSVLVIATWRTEDVPSGDRLRALLAEAMRSNAGSSVALGRLGAEDVARLAAWAGGSHAGPATLFDQTQGVPFFVVEYLRAEREHSDSGEEIPAGVRALLRSRLAGLPPLASQLLTAAAVIGGAFDADTLGRAAGRSRDEVVEGLDELLRRRLLLESEGAYRFAHDRMRDLVLAETSAVRTSLLHGRLADALARAPVPDDRALVIGRHLLAAGRRSDAAGWFATAGRRARELFANAEAAAHLQQALELGAPAATVLEPLGDSLTSLGRYREASNRYQQALVAGPSRTVALRRKLAGIELRLGRWEAAQDHLGRALAGLPEHPSAERASVLADRAIAAFRLGDAEQARRLGEQALSEAETARDPEARAEAHNVAGLLARASGDVEGAVRHFTQSLELSAGITGMEARIAALNNLALATKEAGRVEEARTHAEQAVALAAEAGDVHREAAIRNNLADLLHLTGHAEEAMEELKRAVALFAEVSATGGEASPEIWKLVDW